MSPGYFLLFLLFFSFSPFPFSFSFHPPRLKVVLMVNIQIFTYQFIYIHIYYLYLRACLFLYKTLGISTMRFRSELEIHWKKKKTKEALWHANNIYTPWNTHLCRASTDKQLWLSALCKRFKVPCYTGEAYERPGTGQELSMTSTNSSPCVLVFIYFLVCCCLLFYKCKNSSTGNLTSVYVFFFFPYHESIVHPS